MRRTLKYAVRLVLMVAVLTSIRAVLSQNVQPNSPYLSALSNLTASAEALARPTCPNKQCNSTQTKCDPQVGFTCAISHPAHHCKGNICL